MLEGESHETCQKHAWLPYFNIFQKQEIWQKKEKKYFQDSQAHFPQKFSAPQCKNYDKLIKM